MRTQSQTQKKTGERISGDKFHPIYGRALGVALEATVYPDPPVAESVEVPEEYKKLVYWELDRGQVRLYYPALANGDMRDAEEGLIIFVPWFDRELPAYHRIQFRIRPFRRDSKIMPPIKFARVGEEKAFGIETKPGSEQAYFHLDFFSKRADEFLSLFVKVTENGGSVYLILEVSPEENTPESVALRVRRIAAEEAPVHLAKA